MVIVTVNYLKVQFPAVINSFAFSNAHAIFALNNPRTLCSLCKKEPNIKFIDQYLIEHIFDMLDANVVL
jgi:hypothetical protein